MLLPAAAAWITAWFAIAMVGPELDARTLSWALWAGGLGTLAMLVVVAAARNREFRTGGTGRGRVVVARLLRAGPALVVALAVEALTSLGCRGRARAAQRFSTRRRRQGGEHGTRSRDVIAAPRVMRGAGWGEASAVQNVRVDGRLVSVDGADAAAVAVTTTLPMPDDGIELGGRVAFDARVSTLPAEEESGFRLGAGGDIRTEPPPPWLAWAAALRLGFADAASSLGGDGGALVPGLAIGDTSAVDADLDAAMKASSLSHLTAVSGANCVIVTAAAFGVAALSVSGA